ncbi:MAG TPA: carbohydrate ABC transporter permease, partial [Kribbella sp.]|nr:carbohydrate ABC transporter permease [Kribbella sp.]
MSDERGALSDADRRQTRIRVPFVIGQVVVFGGLLVAGLGPFLWLLKAAISPTQDSIRQPLAFFPSGEIQWQNLATAWQQGHIGYYLGNTAIIAAGTALASLIICTTAGYVLSVLRPRWGPVLSAAILVTLFVPHIVSLVPLYLTVLKLPVVHSNLTNTFWAVWLPPAASAFN